jgi:Protein involved in biosynthesis of mitomycin antibiotics/polyketide fumonisin
MTTIGHAKACFERDGATLVKSVISIDWIERARLAVDLIMSDGESGRNLGRDGEGRFFGDSFLWLRSAELAAFVRESGLGEIAGTITGSPNIRFFADQLLVKEPRALKPTPWHQDLPYWPLTGDQMLSIWVPLDAATPESGVVTYVRGSHLWGRTFPPESFNKDDESGLHQSPPEAPGTELYTDPRMDLDDIRERPELYDFVTWNVEPGDVIIHHPLVVHGAPGNSSETRRRRALATRWIGDDVRWDDSHAHFMERFKSVENFPYPALTRGDMVADERIFPLIWSCFSPGDSRN